MTAARVRELAETLAPLRADPAQAAILLDVDGTLAPIVRFADDANVPEATRSLLIQIARRYGLVACVSGRQSTEARRIVSIGAITYVGNHGAEVLRGGEVEPELDPAFEEWARRVRAFASEHDDADLTRLRVRLEDKGGIVAFHWRGTPDEAAAEVAVRELAADAEAAGFGTHWGRKVLEVRPPVAFDKGRSIDRLLRSTEVSAALYAGDDKTDLDAFRALERLAAEGKLTTIARVGVRSDEGPAEIEREADVVVDGTEGMRAVLEALLTK